MRLELYRVCLVAYALWLSYYATCRAFDYAFAAVGQSGLETAGVIAAIYAAVAGIIALISKILDKEY